MTDHEHSWHLTMVEETQAGPNIAHLACDCGATRVMRTRRTAAELEAEAAQA